MLGWCFAFIYAFASCVCSAHGGLERALDPPELESHVAVMHVGAGSSARAASAVRCGAISQAPVLALSLKIATDNS